MKNIFPDNPSITVHDSLAELLGVGDGLFTYTFEDVIKLSGHACPTVAGAFLMSIGALKALYNNDIPERGDIEITIYDEQGKGVIGPISQVFTLITGAASNNGFHGLAGRYVRSNLMKFVVGSHNPYPFVFKSLSKGESVAVSYDSSKIAAVPEMMQNLQSMLREDDNSATREKFLPQWRGYIKAILEDAGKQTVSITKIN